MTFLVTGRDGGIRDMFTQGGSNEVTVRSSRLRPAAAGHRFSRIVSMMAVTVIMAAAAVGFSPVDASGEPAPPATPAPGSVVIAGLTPNTAPPNTFPVQAVVLVAPDGSQPTTLQPAGALVGGPVFNPDGTRYAQTVPSNGLHPYTSAGLWNIGGGPCPVVLNGDIGVSTSIASWSPDGLRLAVFTDGFLGVASSNTGATKVVPIGQLVTGAWGWSPDSSHLLVGVVTGPAGPTTLESVEVDTGATLVIASQLGPIQSASWSPDGTRVLWSDGVHVRITGGSSPVDIARAGPGSSVGAATFSPDGSEVAYVTGGDNANLWIAASDGSGSRQLTSSGSVAGPPLWSPDGTELAVAKGTDGLVVNTAGATISNLPGIAPVAFFEIKASVEGGGYRVAASDGTIGGFGTRCGTFGSPAALAQPIVGMASTPSGDGYWLVASDGGIFSFGDAAFHGSFPTSGLTGKVIGMAV